jgi:alkylation response protein AidB-like acyl-CoA dehydrogenase
MDSQMSAVEPDSAQSAALRREVRTWVEANWDDQLTLRQWWRRLGDSGWGFPTWPAKWFGRDLAAADAGIVHEELSRVGAVSAPAGPGPAMGGPMLLGFGTDDQRERWLRPLVYGEEVWCQFFSEPEAGSDLASLRASAVPAGDEWLINGQKIWNSATQFADRALLVARTDPDAAKHRGITFFVIDVHQPGIEIRPIKQMNGEAEFNEAFMTDARVADSDRVGDVNAGWAVTMGVLADERSSFAGGGDTSLRWVRGGSRAGNLDRKLADLLAEPPISLGNRLLIGSVPALVDLAREYKRFDDSVIRQRIAEAYALSEALRLTEARGRAARGKDGGASSVAHLGGVKLMRLYRDLVGEIAGPAAMLADTDIAQTILTAPAFGLQGGTEQIQKNVIGERILSLPREPQVGRDAPFRASL